MSSVGYGDISPTSTDAEVLARLETIERKLDDLMSRQGHREL
jgi:hypothetical protein